MARLLGMLHMYHLRGGDYQVSPCNMRERSSKIAGTLGDAEATALAHSLLGISRHLMGDLNGARVELEAALEPGPGAPAGRAVYFGFDHLQLGQSRTGHDALAAGLSGAGDRQAPIKRSTMPSGCTIRCRSRLC